MGTQANLRTNEINATFRVDREQWERFKALVARDQRTASQQIRWYIDRAIEEREDKQAA